MRPHNRRSRRIVRDAAPVEITEDIAIRLARGELGAAVKDKKL